MPRPGGGGAVGSGTRAAENSGKSCDSDAECGELNVCFQGTCVGDGTLRFSLSWTDDTDYDLHVITPAGTEIFFGNESAEGGLLDVDDCVFECREPGGTHVENIFFEGTPARGEYTYWVHNFSGAIEGRFEIEVSEAGRVVDSEGGTLTIEEPRESMRFTHRY